MTSTRLKNTTAAILTFSLAMPLPVSAQAPQADGSGPCTDLEGPALEACLAEESQDGAAEQTPAPAVEQVEEGEAAAPAAQEDPAGATPEAAESANGQADAPQGDAAPSPEAEAAADTEGDTEGDGTDRAQDRQPAENGTDAGQAPVDGTDVTESEPVESDPVTDGEPLDGTTAETDTARPAPDDDAATAQPEESAPEDAEVEQTEGETPAETPEDTAGRDAETGDTADGQATAEDGAADAEEGSETAAEPTPQPSDDAAEAAESPPASDAQATAEDGAAAAEEGGETAAEPTPQPSDDAAEAAESPPADDAQATAESDIEIPQEDTEESVAAANRAETAAAAAADGAGEPEDVVTETVAEDQARRSGDEFETDLTEGAAAAAQGAQAQATAPDDADDGGLSNLEKFAIGAAGLIAAGALLNRGDEVVSNSGDRVVIRREGGNYEVLRDDNALIRRPGTEIETQRYSDGSTRVVATREDGTRIVTVRSASGQVLRRTRILPDGREAVLFDDTDRVEPVQLDALPRPESRTVNVDRGYSDDELREALLEAQLRGVDRRFSLRQIRSIEAVRTLVPTFELDAVTFRSGSAAIAPDEAEELAAIGRAMNSAIDGNPVEVFLIEGHTDAVGPAAYNLALSDRRAESVALALSEYFDVPPENMVIQGYGESDLKVATGGAERANRRVTVRRITPLLQAARAD